MKPLDRLHKISNWHFKVTMALSFIIQRQSKVLATNRFFIPNLHSTPPFSVFATIFRTVKLRIAGLSECEKFEEMFSCFHTTHECDRHGAEPMAQAMLNAYT